MNYLPFWLSITMIMNRIMGKTQRPEMIRTGRKPRTSGSQARRLNFFLPGQLSEDNDSDWRFSE